MLKKLSIHCNFDQYLNRALGYRFVCGLQDFKIQTKLLNTEQLIFDYACRIATAMEMSSKQAQEIRPSQSTANKVTSGQKKYPGSKGGFRSTTGTVSCYRCGNNHLTPDCPHKDVTCKRCRKQGHFARFCKTKLGKGHTKNFTSTKPTAGVVKVVTE